MKKILAIVVILSFVVLAVPLAYGQPEGAAPRPFGPAAAMHQDMSAESVVTPDQLAKFDEKTRAAWEEIESYKLKKRNNYALAFAAAFAIGLAVFGGALSQGRVASAAVEGIARNPEAGTKIFTPLIICMALIESLVIYALVIAFLIQGKM